MEGCTGFWVVGCVFWLTCVPVWGVLPSWLMSVWLTGRATRQPSLHGTHRGAVGSVRRITPQLIALRSSAHTSSPKCAQRVCYARGPVLAKSSLLGGGDPDLGRERGARV